MLTKRLFLRSLVFVWVLMLSACVQTPAPELDQSPNTPEHSDEIDKNPNEEQSHGLEDQRVRQEETDDFIAIYEDAYAKFFETAKEGPIIPGLLQDYVPQGITWLKDENWLILSHYSSTEERPSILTVIDLTTEKLIKTLDLYEGDQTPYTGHAGGITLSEKYLWIASGGKVRQISIEALKMAEDRSKLMITADFPVDSRASFNYFKDGVLWAGDFAYGTKYPTPKTHHIKNRQGKLHTGWIAGYELDGDSDEIVNNHENSEMINPNYIISIPIQIQGVVITEDYIILSQSYGRNNPSSILFYPNELLNEPHQHVEQNGENIPLWFLDEQNLLGELITPPMSEGIVSDDEQLYVLYESGANAYRVSGSLPLLRIQQLPLDVFPEFFTP